MNFQVMNGTLYVDGAPRDVVRTYRAGNDLIVVLATGEEQVMDNFFQNSDAAPRIVFSKTNAEVDGGNIDLLADEPREGYMDSDTNLLSESNVALGLVGGAFAGAIAYENNNNDDDDNDDSEDVTDEDNTSDQNDDDSLTPVGITPAVPGDGDDDGDDTPVDPDAGDGDDDGDDTPVDPDAGDDDGDDTPVDPDAGDGDDDGDDTPVDPDAGDGDDDGDDTPVDPDAGDGDDDGDDTPVDPDDLPQDETLTVDIDVSEVAVNGNGVVTFTFSEAVTNLGAENTVASSYGFFSDFQTEDGITWTATLTQGDFDINDFSVIFVDLKKIITEDGEVGTTSVMSDQFTVNTSADPDAGDETPVDPDAGDETPVDPDAGDETPVDPDAGDETPVDPDAGDETPVDPDAGDETPVDPDAGDETPTPPVTNPSIPLTAVINVSGLDENGNGTVFVTFNKPVALFDLDGFETSAGTIDQASFSTADNRTFSFRVNQDGEFEGDAFITVDLTAFIDQNLERGEGTVTSDTFTVTSDAGDETPVDPDAGDETPVDPDAGDETPVDPDAGDETPVDPDAGDETPVDPDAGDETPVDPDAGDETPVDPDAGDETPVDPDAGDETPVDPDAGDETPVDPDAGDETPVDPDAGDETPVDPDAGDEMLSVDIDVSQIAENGNGVITFTFSEAVTNLGAENTVASSYGFFSDFQTEDGITWTATLTQGDFDINDFSVILMDLSEIMTEAGGFGQGSAISEEFLVNTSAEVPDDPDAGDESDAPVEEPTDPVDPDADGETPDDTGVDSDGVNENLDVDIDVSQIAENGNGAVTFTFSEAVTNLGAESTVVSDYGFLSDFQTEDGITWTATLTQGDFDINDVSVISVDLKEIVTEGGEVGATSVMSEEFLVNTSAEPMEEPTDPVVDGDETPTDQNEGEPPLESDPADPNARTTPAEGEEVPTDPDADEVDPAEGEEAPADTVPADPDAGSEPEGDVPAEGGDLPEEPIVEPGDPVDGGEAPEPVPADPETVPADPDADTAPDQADEPAPVAPEELDELLADGGDVSLQESEGDAFAGDMDPIIVQDMEPADQAIV